MKKLIVLTILLMMVIGCEDESGSKGPPANVIYVNCLAAGGGDGETWDTALQNLEEAIDLADETKQIWVAAGDYGSQGTATKIMFPIYGGFTGDETSTSQRNISLNVVVTGVMYVQSGKLDGLITGQIRATDNSYIIHCYAESCWYNDMTSTYKECVFKTVYDGNFIRCSVHGYGDYTGGNLHLSYSTSHYAFPSTKSYITADHSAAPRLPTGTGNYEVDLAYHNSWDYNGTDDLLWTADDGYRMEIWSPVYGMGMGAYKEQW